VSIMRRKRLERLEALRRPEGPTFDYAGSATAGLALFEWFAANVKAVARGKASEVPVYGPDPGCEPFLSPRPEARNLARCHAGARVRRD
jgi:hypothetical protein